MLTIPDTIQLDFTERVAAYATARGLPPYEGPRLDHTAMRAREKLVRFHGPTGDVAHEFVWPGRTVIEVPGWIWPFERPEDCAELDSTIWFDVAGHLVPDKADLDAPDGVVLLCAGCGLDCT
ncbi:hypothetical protein [Pseudonocardia kunmingensis]|uniref:Uncharacterized protein n=1 Tax=Pseudonocardia kunmingensis TaxID=630975 RepID=A0A543CXU6_9PSEU|nr:hypothetical protein [Pseudonocardia kunmingensis]TQM01688.1 hypothetical protein FB558_8589 [Pseudonocardia kunmingensis]